MDSDGHCAFEIYLVFGKSSHLWLLVEEEVDALLGPVDAIVDADVEGGLPIHPEDAVLNYRHLDDESFFIDIEEVLSEVKGVARFVQDHLEDQIIDVEKVPSLDGDGLLLLHVSVGGHGLQQSVVPHESIHQGILLPENAIQVIDCHINFLWEIKVIIEGGGDIWGVAQDVSPIQNLCIYVELLLLLKEIRWEKAPRCVIQAFLRHILHINDDRCATHTSPSERV